LKGRAKWLKKVDDKPKPKVQAAAGTANIPKQKKKKVDTAVVEEKKWMVEDMTEDLLEKKVNELVASRGRKSTDPKVVFRKLEVLSKVARMFGPKKEISVLMHLVSVMYDSHRVIDDYMDLLQWRTCSRCLSRIVSILNSNKELVLGIMANEDVTDLVLASQIKSDFMKKSDEESNKESDTNSNVINVVGTLEHKLLRLEDELTKSLQQIDPHSQVTPCFYPYSYPRANGRDTSLLFLLPRNTNTMRHINEAM
jgi:translation initiation factor 3 subunit C